MKIVFTRAGQVHLLKAERSANGVELQIAEERVSAHKIADALPRVSFLLDGKIHTARVARDGKKRWVHYNGTTFVLERGETSARVVRAERAGATSGLVTAPMPGQVRALLVQNGDWVEQGQPLLLLEAMKMEIRVAATCAGQIVQMALRIGQIVEHEQILVTIQARAE